MEDVIGFRVRARDGAVGRVRELVSERRRPVLVVRTRRRLRLVPADAVIRVDTETRTVELDRTRAQVRSSPRLGSAEGEWDRMFFGPSIGMSRPLGPTVVTPDEPDRPS